MLLESDYAMWMKIDANTLINADYIIRVDQTNSPKDAGKVNLTAVLTNGQSVTLCQCDDKQAADEAIHDMYKALNAPHFRNTGTQTNNSQQQHAGAQQ
jgi:hypothetical protein